MSETEQLRREGFLRLFQSAPIVRHFGMSLSYDGQGRAVVRLPFNPNLDHALLQTHGGAVATLLDTAGWFTVAPHFDRWVATVEFNTRLLEPVAGQDLRAQGQIVRLGKRIVFAEMRVETGNGRLVAMGAGTFTVTGVALKLP